MSQSATLYLISNSNFEKLKNDSDFSKMADEYETFEQNFEGLTYILTKALPKDSETLINEIFNPIEFIGEPQDFENIDFDDFDEDLIFGNKTIYYLSPEKVVLINGLLQPLNDSTIGNLYDSKELNNNGVYPEVWHDDESEDQAFNKRHIIEGVNSLKTIFTKAKDKQYYILSFVG